MIGGLGTGPLLYGAGFFAVVLAIAIGVFIFKVDPLNWQQEPWAEFADACHEIVDSENADAIAFIPYSDGPLIPKPAIDDRELLGGKGGYRTPDGERIYVDGQGNGTYSLEGVDAILAIDPTEHAAAVDPLKAWIWHQKDTADEWIKVDREGNVIEAAEGIKRLAEDDDATPPAMEIPKGEGMPSGDGGVAADGGYASEVHKRAHKSGMSLSDAKAELETEGLLHRIVDIAPPREAVIDDETGEVDIEQASHVAVDVSEAANMLPKKTNTTEWQTMEEKAKQEGRDEEKLMEYFIYGGAAGALGATIVAVVMALVFGFI